MKLLFTYAALVLFLTVAAPGARAANIAVLLSSEAEVYRETLDGFREVLRHASLNVQTIATDTEGQRDQLRKLRMLIEPDIVLVIGTPALQAVAGKITHIPIIYAMVFNPADSAIGGSKNIIGISMIPSAQETIALIKELDPKIRRVGIMHDPSRIASLFWQAQSEAQKAKIQVIDRKIRAPADIAGALKSFENAIDLLWLWPDERFLSEDILQRVLLFSFVHKIPVLGLSERHTEMGALLSASYHSAKEMGQQAGAVANYFLHRKNETPVSLLNPRQVRLTINFNTAKKFNFKFSDTLLSRTANVVQKPVYKEGDWWVFRIKLIDAKSIKTENHRVIFKNNKFESDDPSFLAGGDVDGTPFFLPFASVYLNSPERKWLDFPLVPGKNWSFRYLRTNLNTVEMLNASTTFTSWTDADAEVIGKAPQLIKTAAGEFEAIEIQRTDYVVGRAELTYYYSPQTRSVVKLRAEFPENSDARYELELVAYGNGGNMGKDLR